MEYDIVGDVHGQADKLEALLLAMGYHLVTRLGTRTVMSGEMSVSGGGTHTRPATVTSH